MYEKLKKILLTRGHVLVKRNFTINTGEYCVFSGFKSIDGNFRVSNWFEKKENAIGNIGNINGYCRENIEKESINQNWQIIDVFDTPQEQFKVGDKVVICENAKEELEKTNNWNKEMQEYSGKIGKIIHVGIGRHSVEFEDGFVWNYTQNCISYPFKEEKEEILHIKLGDISFNVRESDIFKGVDGKKYKLTEIKGT